MECVGNDVVINIVGIITCSNKGIKVNKSIAINIHANIMKPDKRRIHG